MKKLLLIITLFLFGVVIVSCGDGEPLKENGVVLNSEVKIIVPNGTPYLAVAGLLENNNINIEVVSGPANLQSALVSGSCDIVIAPINLGVNLYNKRNSKYKISHILTMNNAYIVTRNENKLDSIFDLKDEEVLGFGETGIPGNILKTLYKCNDLDINLIDFQYASSANVYSVFAGDSTKNKYALMSEPEISKLIVKDKIEVKTIDLCEELGLDVAQACVFINPYSENQEDINKVLELIENNVKELNEKPSFYVERIITLDRVFEVTGKDVLIASIPKTNIVFKEAKPNKNNVESILTILGVGLPNEEFYYKK